MRPALAPALAVTLALTAVPALAFTPADRDTIAALLIERGYSCVFALERDGSTWTGEGFEKGAAIRFAIDATTGRVLSETHLSGSDY